jgi:hypothetical protein
MSAKSRISLASLVIEVPSWSILTQVSVNGNHGNRSEDPGPASSCTESSFEVQCSLGQLVTTADRLWLLRSGSFEPDLELWCQIVMAPAKSSLAWSDSFRIVTPAKKLLGFDWMGVWNIPSISIIVCFCFFRLFSFWEWANRSIMLWVRQRAFAI